MFTRISAPAFKARSCVIAGLTATAALALPGAAQAGRLVVTGHDADHHCSRDAEANRAACHFFGVATTYVRGGAPDPTKPVLVLDRGALDVRVSLTRAFRDAPVPHKLVDPRSARFATLPITTAEYSAIIIAASKDSATDTTPQDLNEFDSTPDTDAINARAADIAAFFDAGGGIYVSSGGAAARADSARYYRFVKITRGGGAVNPPFSLTPLGRTLGFQDAREFPGESNDINCCATHLSFQPPAPESPLKVAEQDKSGLAVTLAADTAKLASIEEPPVKPGNVFTDLPGSKPGASNGGGGTKPTCVPKRSRLKVSLRRPRGVRFVRVSVYVNGKLVRKVGAKRLGVGRKTRAFYVRLSKTKRSKIRIVALTASGKKLTFRKTYRPCR